MRFPYFSSRPDRDPLLDKVGTYFINNEERQVTFEEARRVERELEAEYLWVLDPRSLHMLEQLSPEVRLQWKLLWLAAARDDQNGVTLPRALALLVRRALARNAPHMVSPLLEEIATSRFSRHELCALTAFDELQDFTRRAFFARSGGRLYERDAEARFDLLRRSAALASSFAVLRYDSMRAGDGTTLLEEAGACRRDWRCGERNVTLFEFPRENLPNYSLHRKDDSWLMRPTIEEGSVFLRRDLMGVRSEAYGTLIVTNASVDQPLPRFNQPLLWSPRLLTPGELGSLSERDLSSYGFHTFLDPSGYPFLQMALPCLTKLMDLLEAGMQGYRRWLFDAHTLTAFVSFAGKDKLVGGYKSPGFAPLVNKLKKLRSEVALVFYPWGQMPWRVGRFLGPDGFESSLPIDDEVLDVLTRLASHQPVDWNAPVPSRVVNFMQLGYDTSGSLGIIQN